MKNQLLDSMFQSSRSKAMGEAAPAKQIRGSRCDTFKLFYAIMNFFVKQTVRS